jgi:hypothetical protein
VKRLAANIYHAVGRVRELLAEVSCVTYGTDQSLEAMPCGGEVRIGASKAGNRLPESEFRMSA